MKLLMLEPIDQGYDPYRPRALVHVDVETEDEACDRVELMIDDLRRERAARSLSRAGRHQEAKRRKGV